MVPTPPRLRRPFELGEWCMRLKDDDRPVLPGLRQPTVYKFCLESARHDVKLEEGYGICNASCGFRV